jgi:hypothetical protein
MEDGSLVVLVRGLLTGTDWCCIVDKKMRVECCYRRWKVELRCCFDENLPVRVLRELFFTAVVQPVSQCVIASACAVNITTPQIIFFVSSTLGLPQR